MKTLIAILLAFLVYYATPAVAQECLPTAKVVEMITNPLAQVLETLVGKDAADFRQAAAAQGIDPLPFDEVIVFHMPSRPDQPYYVILTNKGCVVAHGVVSQKSYDELRQGRGS
jgi:hypothetical protein